MNPRSPSPLLTARFGDALQYASRVHATQARKGTRIPYVSHLLSAAALVLEHGGDEDEAIAALLHDAVEDQGGPYRQAEIEMKFGEKVGRIVAACTDSAEEHKPPWRARKEAHIARLASAPQDVLRVVSADKLHNARSILMDLRRNGDAVWERFSGGKSGTLWYYRSLSNLLSRSGDGPLAQELARVVDEIHARAQSSQAQED